MKKITLLLLITLVGCLTLNAQTTRIGATGGVVNAGGRVEFDNGQTVNNNRQGFYAGLVFDYGITSRIHIETELDYVSAGNTDFFQVPLLVKFYMGNTDFYFQVGGQYTYTLDETSEEISRSNIAFAFGAGFDINKRVNLNVRFAPQLNDFQEEEVNNIVSTKINYLNIGVAYKLAIGSREK
ncbi:outer membrane beta-barrel protein [uncultured Dokdonia sp.]|uniref:outer membrane beta-barrel protein n=1 Tax=uncultured Dokdonia sp. TaxID=575653 RepID=UPI0026259EF1|nr:outer membrane beta-barrel protein [uncultured Dokdonia sp.]